MDPASPRRAREHEEAFGFDEQASTFDARAGIPADAARAIAAAVVALGPARPDDPCIEIGAGTGEIGCDLARLGVRYVAVDLARPMLVELARKLGPLPRGAVLVQADARERWPLASGCARWIFLSRSAHLFEPAALAAEAERVARSDGAWLVLGQVRRAPDSVRARMRERMRALLAERGIEGKGGERAKAALAAEIVARGGEALAPREVASWEVRESPAASIASWRAKNGLAGRAIAPELKAEVLARLETWARAELGSPSLVARARERYDITPLRLPRA